MAEKQTTQSGGIGFLGLLTILFIGLKLTGHIDWSWWLVLAPIWGTFAFVIVVFLMLAVYYYLKGRK